MCSQIGTQIGAPAEEGVRVIAHWRMKMAHAGFSCKKPASGGFFG